MNMIRETAYDEVFDAQMHFRSLLDSMARPGKINNLAPVTLTPPPGLNAATVMTALSLMNGDVSFYAAHDEHGESAYLAANTRAAISPTETATFLFAHGTDGAEVLESANCGTLTYPDTSATLVLQLDAASAEPLSGGLRLAIEGPGVDGRKELYVRGLNPDLLLALQARNAEFPLGIDTFLTFSEPNGGPAVVGLPRTAKVAWEAC